MASVYAMFDRRDRLIVLTFHRIGPGWAIGRQVLRRHLEYLRAHFRLSTPARVLEEGIQGQVALVVVDDAHSDIYEVLYPLARMLEVPFAIAVPTDFFLRERWLWFDAFSWLLQHAPRERRVTLPNGLSLRPGDAIAVASVKAAIKRLLPEEREDWLHALACGFGLRLPARPTNRYRSLTREQMRELLASGLVELCPHTVTHTVATVLRPEQLRAELIACKAELEDFAGRNWPAFCYPDGELGTFDAHTASLLSEAGFRMAFTSLEGINWPANLDWYALRRLHVHPSLRVLHKNASGLGAWFARRPHATRHALGLMTATTSPTISQGRSASSHER